MEYARLSAVMSLDLPFLIDRDDDRMGRRVHVEAHGIFGADGHRVFPADHPRRAEPVLWQGGQPRHDRRPPRHGPYRRRPAQPDARRPLCVRHHKNISDALRIRHAARPARIEMLEDAGLLSKDKPLAGELPGGFGARDDEADDRPDEAATAIDRTLDDPARWPSCERS
ncbi:protein of unknown function (plasmid) [Methylocella tundrae]|uniref:Uncharacterized protein n=1 Tax=Methylocella tundrae TaxID=227605 RepID=A0A4U8Z709_METTU|nr:protein of unknown function [Methylocella tundrae]